MNVTSPSSRPRGLLVMLSLAVLIGVMSLMLAVTNALALNEQADERERERLALDSERERERLALDYASCLRGNDFRQQIIEVGKAQGDLLQGVIDVSFDANGDAERQARIDAFKEQKIGPLFIAYDGKLAEIKLNNCDEVVPGGAEAAADDG